MMSVEVATKRGKYSKSVVHNQRAVLDKYSGDKLEIERGVHLCYVEKSRNLSNSEKAELARIKRKFTHLFEN